VTTIRKWTGRESRALREAMRLSVRDFAGELGVTDRAVSKWEAGGADFVPRLDSQAILDTKLRQVSDEVRARFELILSTAPANDQANENPEDGETGPAWSSANQLNIVTARPAEMGTFPVGANDGAALELGRTLTPEASSERAAWEVSELIQRLEYSEVGANKIELLAETVNRLCSDYGREPAHSLHPVVREWVRRVIQAMDHRTTLAQHRELLVCAGWLFLLSGCVEYDMGWKGAADTSRIAALQIGRETGHGEIQAWSWEMAAWFALTQGRIGDVAAYVDAGQRIGGNHSVIVQLDAQLAKAGARMGDSALVERALESGYTKLSRMPRPDNPRNHFIVDPDKWDFYAMDAYRLLGDDARATAHAKEVLRLGQGADGKELAPMRMAEARLTLGFSAARKGELEEAVTVGESAFSAERKSMPSLLMVAGELKSELVTRYPREVPTRDYCEKLTELTRENTPKLEA
jgi:transcriptional regulator with XRE-family HTH domain